MADEIDRACDREQMDRDAAIAAALASTPKALKPIGMCHNCEEPLTSLVFCDHHCRDDWQLRNPDQ